MKRILCLFLIFVVIMSISVISVTPVAAIDLASSRCDFYWQYGGGRNYAESSRPELDFIKLTDLELEGAFFARKGFNDWGYRVYVSTPKQKDWRAVATFARSSLSEVVYDNSRKLSFKCKLRNSDLYYIYGKSSVGDIRKLGKWDSSRGLWYYPMRVTVRAVDNHGNAIGDFRGSAMSGVASAWLSPGGKSNTGQWCAPVLNPISDKGWGGDSNINHDMKRAHWHIASFSFPLEYTSFIRIYYKKNGNWTKLKDVSVKNVGWPYEFSFTFKEIGNDGNTPYELTARAFDSDGDWISGYLSGAKAFPMSDCWSCYTNKRV